MSDEISDKLKEEYILQTLKVMEEDKKSVLLYVAFDFAVVSLTVAGNIKAIGNAKSYGAAFALGLIFLAGILFFHYYRKVHRASFEILENILTLNVDDTRTTREAVWDNKKYFYIVGYAARVVGVLWLVYIFITKIPVSIVAPVSYTHLTLTTIYSV